MEFKSEIWKVECCSNSAIRRIYAWQMHGKKEKRKVIYSLGGKETEIDFVLVTKRKQKVLKDVEVIPWELQHRLVLVDVKKENLFKHMKMKRKLQWRVWKLKKGKNLRTK